MTDIKIDKNNMTKLQTDQILPMRVNEACVMQSNSENISSDVTLAEF